MEKILKQIQLNYPMRYTIIQKQLFCEFAKEYFENKGIKFETERQHKNCNIIIGDIESAELIISAHYDTSNEHRKPFISGVTKKYFKSLIYYLKSYRSFVTAKSTANRNNLNDNTSGLCCLFKLSELKNKKTAFILFDNEENNLKGSRLFNKKYKDILGDKLLINLDCVGCGDYTGIIYYTYFNDRYASKLMNYFQDKQKVFKMLPNNIYATDAKIFRKSLNISSFYKVNNEYVYYNIHTLKDNKVEIENMENIVKALTDFINEILIGD